MHLTAWLIEEPWGLLNGRAIRVDFSRDNHKIINTSSFYRCLIVPDGTSVFVDDFPYHHEKQLNDFMWEGKSHRRLLLPIELPKTGCSENTTNIKLKYGNLTFEFSIVSARIENIESIKSYVQWQIDCFLELVDIDQNTISFEDCSLQQSVRRGWGKVQDVWLKDENRENEAQISLIVRLAKNPKLKRALKFILSTPNKVLKRQRTLENVATVVEMDSACLQWYIRQPGSNLQEKAGQQQKILAVTRQESFNILENQVTRWVVDRLKILSDRFLNENFHYVNSEKFIAVRNFKTATKICFDSSPLREISAIHHFPKPNYALMHHHLYQIIWQVYLQLRKEEKLEDDCWKWQNTMWHETGKQLISALLTKLGRNSVSLNEEALSMCYIRKEQMNGLWTDPPIAPGPFKTSQGRIDYIDLRDGMPDQKFADWMGTLGLHQALRQKRIDGRDRVLALWFWNDPEKLKDNLNAELEKCQQTLYRSLTLLDNNIEAKGIIVASDPFSEESSITRISNKPSLTLFKISKNFHKKLNSLITSFGEVMEFFN